MGTKNTNHVVKLLPILFSFFVMGFVDIVSTLTGYVKRDFGLSDANVNLLPMMVFLWFAICSLPVGVMMRKVGRKNTVLLSATVTTIGLLIPMVNYSFASLIVAFALLGIGNTILQVSLNPLLTNVVAPDKVTSSLTFGQFIKAISSALGPIIVGFASTALGQWQYIFPIYAAATVISATWLIFTSIEEDKVGAAPANSGFKILLPLIKDKTLLILFSVIVFIVGFEVGLMTTVPKYLGEKCGLPLEEGGYANTLYFIARTIGTFLGAILLARVSSRKFLIVTTTIAIFSFVSFMFLDGLTVLYISLFLVGLMCANVFAITFSKAIQYKPEYTDEISSFMIVGVGGGALFPPLIGLLADATSQQVSLTIPLVALGYILFCAIRVMK